MTALPTGWETAALGDVASDISYDFTTTSLLNGNGPKLLRITDIQNGNVDWSAVPHCVDMPRPSFLLQTGDIAIARTGATTGKSFLIGKLPCPTAFASYLIRARFAEGVEPKYAWAFMQSAEYWSQIQIVSKGTAQPGANAQLLSQLQLPIAPLNEQRRIIAKLDSLTAKSKRSRDHLDHVPRLVEKYKQAILAAAFRGDLTREWRAQNPTDVWSEQQLAQLEQSRKTYLEQRRGSRLSSSLGELKELSPLPDGWFPAVLADVGSLQVGYAYKSKWYSKEGVRLLRGANIAPGIVTWDDEVCLPTKLAADYSEYVLDAGDIVIAMDRPIISTGLKAARITQADAGALLVQRVARYVPSTFADGHFVWHFINSQLFIDHAVSQSTGSDLPHISSNDILTTPMALPVLQEQREIVRRVEAALAWIDRLAGEAASARKLVDHLDRSVLAKAFQGELVSQDPSDEPASVLLERIQGERAWASKKPKRVL